MLQESLENHTGRQDSHKIDKQHLDLIIRELYLSRFLCTWIICFVLQGSFIPVIVDITANHQGYFEFKICANNDIFMDPEQSCFESSPSLWVGGGDPLFDNR